MPGETIEDLTGDGIEEAEEGRVITALHRQYERNSALVQAKKKKRALTALGRLACEACGFDFRERYGDHGEGFIECHHTKPVHALKPGDKTRSGTFAFYAPTVTAWSMQRDFGSQSKSW